MKTYLCAVSLLFLLTWSLDAQMVQATIKPGSVGGQVDIFFLPNFSNSIRFFDNLSITIAIPTVSPTPTASITNVGLNAMTFDPILQMPYTTPEVPGYTFYTFGGTFSSEDPVNFTANMEFKAFTITFSGSMGNTEVVRLASLDGFSGGSTNLQAYTYIQMNAIGPVSPDPTSGGVLFYASPGSSTTGQFSAQNPFAQTIVEVELPIELLTFEPRTNQCDTYMYWETATEQNFGYYEIEASKDGRAFKALAQQKPASSNSSEKRTYKYLIPRAYQGFYFRLKAVDLDGSFEYSDIITTPTPCSKAYGMQLSPNPNYVEKLTVEIQSAEAQEQVQLVVFDALGKAVQLQKVDLLPGANKVPIDTEALPSGTYYVRLLGVPQLSEPLKFIRSNF